MGEEHLGQLPEVEELISATAQGDVEVGAIFLQGSLLELLSVLYYKKKVLLASFLPSNVLKRESVPFCLALLMISMCFMETLRSFFVMRDATST